MRAGAAEQLGDLTTDVELLALLVVEVLVGAREAYEGCVDPQPGSVSFRVGWQAGR
jgi:hypothetical protein